MDRLTEISLAKRLLAHVSNKTTDSSDRQMRVPVSEYLDEATRTDEIEHHYKRKPVVVGLSAELPEVGSFLSVTMVNVPILVTRTSEGLKAFLNVCRHRGALVAPENCSGRQTRFACPYHGWTYGNDGRLLGVAEPKSFGPLDNATHGLTELAVAERSGLIFVILTPGSAFAVIEWMAGADNHLGTDDRLTDYQVVGTRQVEAANWKLVIEGHLEGYHFSMLHSETVGRFMYSNCTTLDRFGPHLLITFVQQAIDRLRDRPEDQWQPLHEEMINPQYLFFPGTLVTISDNSIIAQIIQPADEPGKSISRLVFAVTKDRAATEEGLAQAIAHLDGVTNLVQKEDYWASHTIQRGLASGAQTEIVFGQNELGLQLFHDSLNANA